MSGCVPDDRAATHVRVEARARRGKATLWPWAGAAHHPYGGFRQIDASTILSFQGSGAFVKWWQMARDMLLFCGGLAGVANEALAREAERPTLLLLYAAMMGLPAFLRADERKNGNGDRNGKR